MKKSTYIAHAGGIAAIYAVITIVLAPISYGPMQVRLSECLTVLPFFTPAAIPGLFVGCLLANLISPVGLIDVICGSLTTLLSASASYLLRKHKFLVPLPPVVFNAVIIGLMLYYAYGVNASLIANMLWVGGGQIISCYFIGYPLLCYLNKRKDFFHMGLK